MTTDQDYCRRAITAYLRSGAIHQPSADVVEREGRGFVVLSNIHGTMAVYVIDTKRNRLRRLDKWPSELAG